MNDMLQYIPQRPPFVLVDALVDSNEHSTHSEFIVPANHVLVEDGRLSESGLLENIAQTAAARAGYASAKHGEPVHIGYIGAVKNFEVKALPLSGEKLDTKITVTNQIFDVTAVTGEISVKGMPIASCEMKIFIIK